VDKQKQTRLDMGRSRRRWRRGRRT
jgi:hypothetical protein